MMDGTTMTSDAAVRAAAVTYCEALHGARADLLDALCHERFIMTCLGADGASVTMERAAFLTRVGGRTALDGAPDYEILSLDVEGDEIAQVKLSVSVPPRRYVDYLGFIRVGDDWRLTTKLFRTVDGPAFSIA